MTRLKRIHTLNSVFRAALIISLLLSLIFFYVPPGTTVEGQASLRLSKTASATASRQVTLNIEKSASPSTLTLNPGESTTVTYAIVVGTTEENEIAYTVTGVITATNTSENPAEVTKVEDVVEYRVGGEGGWITAGSTVISNPQSPVLVGGSVNYEYTVTFTLPADVTPTAMQNTAYVTISNRGGHEADEPYHHTVSFDVPTPDSASSTVQVTDTESITSSDGGVSFSVDSVTWDGGSSSVPDGPWSVNAPNTITVTKTITASATATPGTYKLEDIASIVGDPSDPAEAEVTITVPSPPSSGGGGGTGGGGGGGQEPAPSGQGGSVVTTGQPAPSPAPPTAVAPTAVAQAAVPQPTVSAGTPSATPLPKKLPYTGFDFWWYGLVSISLIAAGIVLQLKVYPK